MKQLEDILDNLDADKINQLGKLLPQPENFAVEPSTNPRKQILNWIVQWKKRHDGTYKRNFNDVYFPTQKDTLHRDFNDELVDHGFYEIARELMVLEQQALIPDQRVD